MFTNQWLLRGTGSFRRRGRRTSSPRQFGHTWPIALLHFSQNVHSYVQMNADPSADSAAPHFSQLLRISRVIGRAGA